MIAGWAKTGRAMPSAKTREATTFIGTICPGVLCRAKPVFIVASCESSARRLIRLNFGAPIGYGAPRRLSCPISRNTARYFEMYSLRTTFRTGCLAMNGRASNGSPTKKDDDPTLGNLTGLKGPLTTTHRQEPISSLKPVLSDASQRMANTPTLRV